MHDSNGDADIENRLVDPEKGVRGKEKSGFMERVTLKLTLPYVKEIDNGNLLYDSVNLNWGSVTARRGGKGKEGSGKEI